MMKSSLDDYDDRLKMKDDVIHSQDAILQRERLNKITDDNKHDIEMTQIKGSLKVKNQEIDWLTKYGEIPIKKPE